MSAIDEPMPTADAIEAHLRAQANQDPRIVRSRQALHKSFLELLEVKPLDQITIRDLADRSGVGYTTFFRHHPNKEAMLGAIVTEQIGCLLSLSLPKLDGGDLRSATMAIFSYVHKHRGLWSTLLTGGAAGWVREEFMRLGREAAASRLPPGKWLPAEMGLALIVSSTLTLLGVWLAQPKPMSTRRIVQIYDRIILSPIMKANRFEIPRKSAKRNVRPQRLAVAVTRSRNERQSASRTRLTVRQKGR